MTKTKATKVKLIPAAKAFAEARKRPGYREAYEALGPEFERLTKKIKAEIKAEMKAWRPGHTAPPDGSWVLLVCDLHTAPVVVARWRKRKDTDFPWECFGGGAINKRVVTHWLPIPHLPKKRQRRRALRTV